MLITWIWIGAVVSGVAVAEITGKFWRERHLHDTNLGIAAWVAATFCALTFMWVWGIVALFVRDFFQLHGTVVGNAIGMLEHQRSLVAQIVLIAFQAPAISASVWGGLTSRSLVLNVRQNPRSGIAREFLSLHNIDFEAVSDTVVGVGRAFRGSGSTSSGRSSKSKSSKSGGGDGKGGSGAEGAGGLLLLLFRVLVVVVVITLGILTAAILIKWSAQRHANNLREQFA